MKLNHKIIYSIAFVLGFIASYFAQIWLFFITFGFLLILITTGRPTGKEKYNPVRDHYQHQHQQFGTLAGFSFVFGTILAFLFKYFIIARF